jgi:hypothetical protein
MRMTIQFGDHIKTWRFNTIKVISVQWLLTYLSIYIKVDVQQKRSHLSHMEFLIWKEREGEGGRERERERERER